MSESHLNKMKCRQKMKRFLLVLWFVTMIGCAKPAPVAPPPAMPADHIRVEPGSVDADAPEEFTKTESGLQYRIRRKTDGKKPTETSIIRVHSRGRLEDGTIVDSTYGKFGQSRMFPVAAQGIPKGLTEGLQLVSEGGMIELIIPPELAYGEAGNQGIPPNATLNFVVELLEIK